MAADRTTSWFGRAWERRHSVRVRTTSMAVLVVAITLIVAGIGSVWWLHRSLTHNVEQATEVTSDRVAVIIESGTSSTDLPVDDVEDEFVQVLDAGGTVVSSSQNVEGRPALADLSAGETERIEVHLEEEDGDLDDEDEPFLAVGRASGDEIIVAGRTLESVDESVDVLIGLLVVGLPLLLIVLALVTWRVVGRALEPVESMRKEVDSISTEALDRRVPTPDSGDEIARLAATMNEMLERLETGQERQRRFVSDASHELRSPVASIRQHAEVTIAHPARTSAEELARVVLEEDLRIQRLVEDLLLLARMDERRADDGTAAVDLDDVVFDEVARMRPIAGIDLDTSHVSAGRVDGDAKRLARLVGNLLDNAVRHARSAVAVSLGEEGDEVVLRVDDDGSGIDQADRGRVFDRFVRLQEARDRDSGGSGLGLAIVAEVAAAHGGTARILEAQSGGARVEVRFPRRI